MPTVPPPRFPPDHPDSQSFVQEALAPAFSALVQAAIDAGWPVREIPFALLCLAVAEIRGQEADADTEAQISAAVRFVEGR